MRSDHGGHSVETSSATGTISGYTVADVGRLLTRARTKRGLSLRDVSNRIGVPQDQLRAAETGQLAARDGLATLKTVRRYADYLGLPGDRFALAILENWPTRGSDARSLHPGAVTEGPAPLQTSPTAAFPALHTATGASSADTGEKTQMVARPTTSNLVTPAAGSTPAHGSAPAAGPVPVTGKTPAAGSTPARGTQRPADSQATAPTSAISRVAPARERSATSMWSGAAFSDTGMAPAVRARSTQIVRRRRRVPAVLQVAIVLVSLGVLAGAAFLAVDRLHPSWLSKIGLTSQTTSVAAGTDAARPTTTGSNTHATSTPSTGAAARGSTASRKSLRLDKTSSSTATVNAGASTFVATVRAVGGPCWVEVTTPTSSAPVFAGDVTAGASESFTEAKTLVVEMGSTSGRLSVKSSAGTLGPTAPTAVPYRFTIDPKS